MPNDYITIKNVAEILMVSQSTVRNWCADGELTVHLTPGGHRRFMRNDVMDFAKKRGLLTAETSSGKARILVVDDDSNILLYVRELLELSPTDFELVTAIDGFDAGAKLRTFKPSVVLLDLKMPGLDGFSVCRRIKEDPDTSSIRVIAMTAHYSESNIKQVLEAGAEACIEKPFEIDQLYEAIGLSSPEFESSTA